MTPYRLPLLVVGVAAVLCAATVANGQDLHSLEFEAAVQGSAVRAAQSDAGRAQSPTGQTRSLTLTDATQLALAHNLDIAVERVNASAIDMQLAGIKASYLPSLSAIFGAQRQTAVPVTLLTGGQNVVTSTVTLNGALTQNVPWGGGSAAVVWNNNRVGTNNFFYSYNPAYNATLSAQYTQPLLRGFHSDAVRQQLVVTRKNLAISDLQLESTITNTLSSVSKAYWDLVFAADSIDAANKAVQLAEQLVDEDQKRVKAGTMARLDVVAARAQEATARHQLVVAEGNRRSADLALKQLLVSGPNDPLWQTTLVPTDRPAVTEQSIDVAAAVRRALAGRTDLAQARDQIAANQASYEYLRDQTRPQADLVGTYALAGVGGTELVHANDVENPFAAPVVGTVPGGYRGAFSSLVENDYPTWGVALNVSVPLGFSAARADAARARLQIDQDQTQLHRIEVSIVSEVTNAAIAVRNNIDNVQTAVVARELAEQQLQVEQKRFAAGMSTEFQVVQAQKDLFDARNTELQALVDYRKSLVEFDRVQQTTLQSAGVTIVGIGGAPLAVGSGHPASPAPAGGFVP